MRCNDSWGKALVIWKINHTPIGGVRKSKANHALQRVFIFKRRQKKGGGLTQESGTLFSFFCLSSSFLCVDQLQTLFFVAFSFRDVTSDGIINLVFYLSSSIPQQPLIRAVFAQIPVLERGNDLSSKKFFKFKNCFFPVVRMNKMEEVF